MKNYSIKNTLKTQKKILSEKINITKNALFFLSLATTHVLLLICDFYMS